MPKYCNKSVITQDTHMPHSMATTSSGETAGTRPTSSDSQKPKPLLLQLSPSLHHLGLGVRCHWGIQLGNGVTMLECWMGTVSAQGEDGECGWGRVPPWFVPCTGPSLGIPVPHS